MNHFVKFGCAVMVLAFLIVEPTKADSANACEIQNPGPIPECQGSSVDCKHYIFSGLEFQRACSILPDLAPELCAQFGVNPPQEPLVNIVAYNMLYFNWEIPAANVPLIEDALGLRDRGFRIVPLEILEDGPEKYYMSLNFYVAPIAGVPTPRSEWSLYVAREGDPKPRYMVVEFFSTEAALDPMSPGFFKPPATVEYSIDGPSVIASNPEFEATFDLPAQPPLEKVAQPWAEANDVLYWLNGIADTALYNGLLTNTPLASIDPDLVQIDGDSPWLSFLPAKPDNVVLFSQPLEFAFTPFFNLTDPGLGLDPGYLVGLQEVSKLVFGGFSFGHAYLVSLGQAEPLVRFNVSDTPAPSIFVNFNIPRKKLKAFEAALELPPGIELAKSKMTPRQRARHMLTLNIYESPDILTGAPVSRAEWSVYVRDKNDPSASGRYLMVIDVESGGPSLNPVEGFTPPNPTFVYTQNGGRVSAAYFDLVDSEVTGAFNLEFDMPEPSARGVRLHREWILSNDRVYWRNGVYDMLFYNGLLLDADVAEVDLSSVILGNNMPWAAYTDAEPFQIAVFRNPLQFVLHPWFNVEELCPP